MVEQVPSNGSAKRFSYKNDISLGNILSIVAMVGTVLYAFGQLSGDVKVNSAQIKVNSDRITIVEKNQNNRDIYGNK